MKNFRQGDVALFATPEIKIKGRPAPACLAENKASGHRHVVRGQADVIENEDGLFIVITGPAALVHEKNGAKADHAPVELPQGIYRVVMQRRFNPFSKNAMQYQTALGWASILD